MELPQTEWVTVQEATRVVGVSESTLSEWLRTGKLAGFKQGHVWCVWLDDLERLLAERRAAAEKARLMEARSWVWVVTRPDVFCPRCGLLTGGGLCELCRRESRGEPYWSRRGTEPVMSAAGNGTLVGLN
jgi:excisionase family DNA binding protein